LIHWAPKTQKQSGYTLKRIRADNGNEFVNQRLRDWVCQEGIKWELSAPYTPQQNGVVERGNRIIMEGTRSMLLGANLPKNLWSYDVKTKCYVLNRTGTASNVNFMTPYKRFWQKRPTIGHLRVFGYATSPKKKKKKLDFRGQHIRMLGYDSEHQAYIVEFLETTRIGMSRSVDFDELGLLKRSHWGEDEYPLTPRETSFHRSVKAERVNDEDDWTNIWVYIGLKRK